MRLSALSQRDGDGEAIAGRLVGLAGPDIVPPVVDALESALPPADVRALMQLMSAHAAALAPALVGALETCRVETARLLIRVLGHAGPGFERALAAQLAHPDEGTVREALRGLIRIGTREAAAFVASHVCEGPASTCAVAEEALWRFPREHACTRALALLDRSDFVKRRPETATRLMERAARVCPEALGPVRRRLAPLRFRIWSPTLMRLGRTAHRSAR
jgi:hypothetical protein